MSYPNDLYKYLNLLVLIFLTPIYYISNIIIPMTSNTQQTLSLSTFKNALLSHSPQLLDYLKLLIYEKNLEDFYRNSTEMMAEVSNILMQANTQKQLSGTSQFIMGLIFCGHIHIFQEFDKIILRTVIQIVDRSVHNRQVVGQSSANKFEQYQKNRRLNSYKLDLCIQVISLTGSWFPFDFLNKNKISIYCRFKKKYKIPDCKQLPKVIYTQKYLKNLQKKMYHLGLQQRNICILCEKHYKDKHNADKGRQTKTKYASIDPDELRQNSSLKFKLQKKALNKNKIRDKISTYYSHLNNVQAQNINSINKSINTVYLQKDKFDQIQRYAGKMNGLIASRTSLEISDSQLIASNLTLHSIVENDVHNSAQYPSNNKQNSSLFKTDKTSKATQEQISQKHDCKFMQRKNKNDLIDFRKQMGKSVPQNAQLCFQLQSLSGIKYKLYKGILKLIYSKQKSIKTINPPQSIIKHKQKDTQSYFMIDMNICDRVSIILNQNDRYGFDQKSQNKQIMLPIGYIKHMRMINAEEWELNKSKLIQRNFSLDQNIARNIDVLAQKLKLKGVNLNNDLAKKFQNKFEINKCKFKFSIYLKNNKIIMQVWCSGDPKSTKYASQLLQQIIQCYGLQ